MNLLNRLNGIARMAAQRTDVIIVAFMLMAIVMMIIPLPTYLVDMLIGLNIALSILILIVAFYIGHSVEFSALPPLILLSTLFRLSLSITTTRLILLHGDAGHIVKAFGDFVIAGQVVVGMVVFLIITVAQFVVITKGAERVAEVAIPVPVNRDLVGIEYKSFGVSLLFNPTLLPNGRIALQVRPEVSSVVSGGTVDFGNFHVPSFSVRRADTRVEVGSGQTFAIAGLFQRESSQDIEKLPLLGDLPILGNLFRSKRFQRNETELVILITPYLVEPVRSRTLATPLDAQPATAAAAGPRSGGGFGFYMN